MRKLFSMEGGIYRFLNRLYELMVLNLCILVTSLPLVTIGKAMTTGYQILLLQAQNEADLSAKTYFRLFKREIGRDIAFFMIDSLVIVLLFFLTTALPDALKIIGLLVLAILWLVAWTVIVIRAVTNKNWQKTYQLSFAICIKYLYAVILSIFLLVISGLFFAFLPKLLILWVFLGISIPLNLSSKLFYPIFTNLGLIGNKEKVQ